jgi:hypothetical protein
LQGPQGPTGVVSIQEIPNAAPDSISAHSSDYVFVGGTVGINATAGDRLVASVGTALGTTVWLGTAEFEYTICSRAAGAAKPTPVWGAQGAEVGGLRTPVTSSVAHPLDPGSYQVGFCVHNWGNAVLDKTARMNGWVMVTR